jgi:hypothetical protein
MEDWRRTSWAISGNDRIAAQKDTGDIGLLTGQGGLEKVYDKLLRGVAAGA